MTSTALAFICASAAASIRPRVVRRARQHDEIALLQQPPDIFPRAEPPRPSGVGRGRRRADHRHIEGDGTLGDGCADMPIPNDADGFAGEPPWKGTSAKLLTRDGRAAEVAAVSVSGVQR